ncbi:L-glutamate gamma-semialdehyde dehydrogenase [Streptomyces scopuliridis]|uniref:L-glutamate gamma-semialdehyde dehydrogenase n=2 Tax=Streptomyces scopuliridis TaxID=452529 RepID=A0A2T7TEM7_9ACTN|nr:L-glutamate gamma-semialdehyde dehydrogenase [Streptomyces scopuliridis]PVE13604.1 1-pyrroline-5-carboxylate dehydrogenase [Streptomyces scopuliridis RB72]WSB33224.1 L-glutamate gamma-semialdehyde dehydrogenase [Streptomyces scopuliridis]WSB97482.1 L-glutamate gamma-semialdehyde dehydrogenase [Streptomyces scopuliridis]WSC08815.1 L-glutamate gamma-semialdehyde dehydrogenase [Streptomyces scopuliridis]
MDAVTQVPAPVNEPVHGYAPGSPELARLEVKLKELAENPVDLPMTIGGEKRMGGGERVEVVQPHNHRAVLGTFAGATQQDARDAIDAALAAAPGWRAMSFDDRAAIILRAAELLAGPWRETLAAATMLGQSKTAQQAEIDTPCELVDFWRFNVKYARDLLAEQPPANSPGVWNRLDHRPLEGFVYAITPFNFTAIAGNLPTAPALMGNVVVWKPSPTQTLAAVLLMELLEEAGLPKGVINLVTGDGIAVSEVALNHRELAGIHFTGSTRTFQHLWKTVGTNIEKYRSYPRIVGETGGKDFVVAHPSADRAVLRTALTRGSFEYQGQKCSASSRAYVPASIWNDGFKEEFAAEVDGIAMGDVTDLSNFIGAVIDERAFAKNKAAIDRAAADPTCTIVAGGTYDDSVGYFVRPTVIVCTDPENEVFTTEYFGPILAVHVYDDADYETVLAQMESVSAYALTGSIIAGDRAAAADAMEKLRYAAGNFYINDKSTGAVVGQQPFGGGRASGTNDKAGAPQNLMRWTLTRAIKETLVPPTDYRYPHMG